MSRASTNRKAFGRRKPAGANSRRPSSRRRMTANVRQAAIADRGAERSHSAGAGTGFGLRPGSSCRRRRRRAAEEREAATGQAHGCLHCGGQRFESPPLHQVVRAKRRDFLLGPECDRALSSGTLRPAFVPPARTDPLLVGAPSGSSGSLTKVVAPSSARVPAPQEVRGSIRSP